MHADQTVHMEHGQAVSSKDAQLIYVALHTRIFIARPASRIGALQRRSRRGGSLIKLRFHGTMQIRRHRKSYGAASIVRHAGRRGNEQTRV